MVKLPGNRLPASSFSPLDSETQRIVLTGFMGAGKSTVGRLIADRIGWDFLDLDICIGTSTGKSTRELFDALGESGFRELEADLWASVLQQSQAIIAPGGAVIDKPENQRILAESAGTFVIFLDAPFHTLIDRCNRQEQGEGATYRPLLHKTEIALERYLERRVLYNKHAHRDINVADKAPEVVVQGILEALFAIHRTATSN